MTPSVPVILVATIIICYLIVRFAPVRWVLALLGVVAVVLVVVGITGYLVTK